MRRALQGALDAELATLALLEQAPDPRPEHERQGEESEWAKMEAAAESAGRQEAEGNGTGRRWGQGRGATLAAAKLKQSAEKLRQEVEQERAAERASPAHAQAAASPAHRALPAPPPPSPAQFSKIV